MPEKIIRDIECCISEMSEMRETALKSVITRQLAKDFEPVERASILQNEFNKINPKFIDSKVNPEFIKFPKTVEKSFESSGKFLLTEVEYSLIEGFIKNEAELLNKVLGLNFSDEEVLFSDPIV